MKVTFISALDTGGLGCIMKKYMERLGHEVTNIVASPSFIQYGNTDIVLADIDPRKAGETIYPILKETDFFVLRWATDALIRSLHLPKFLKSNNFIYKVHGTETRVNYQPWSLDYWKFSPNKGAVVGWLEPNIWQTWETPMFYHIERPCDFERLPKRANPEHPPFLLHSPTSRIKKGTMFLELAFQLLKERKGKTVNYRYLQGLPYDEAQRLKAKASLVFDQLGFMGGYGLASVEAMHLGIPCMAEIGPAVYSLHPELEDCMVNVNSMSIADKIEAWIDDPDIYKKLGKAGKKYAHRVHDPLKIAKQYIHLFNEIKYGWTPSIIGRPKHEEGLEWTVFNLAHKKFFENVGDSFLTFEWDDFDEMGNPIKVESERLDTEESSEVSQISDSKE